MAETHTNTALNCFSNEFLRTGKVRRNRHQFDMAAGGLPEFGELRPLTRGAADMVDALVVVLYG